MLAQEKFQILVAICTSLPAIAEKDALIQAAGVPIPDAAIITGTATSSSEETGTSTGSNSPGSQDILRGSGTTNLPDHPRLSAPINLPASCLIASDLDSASKTEAGSNSEGSSERDSMKFALHLQLSGCEP